MVETVLAIVVPCYNEEEVLPQTNQQLRGLLDTMMRDGLVGQGSYLLYVDDGSRDRTWMIIEGYSNSDAHVRGLKLAGNVGHQNALMAGLETARQDADIIVSIDADLQDDIKAIPEMVKKYDDGCDIVYGVRRKRTTDTLFKRTTAQNLDLLEYINSKKKKVDISDLIQFYNGGKVRNNITKNVRTKFADGGVVPSLRTDIDINDRLLTAIEDYAERDVVVSVVDINRRQQAVKNVQVLAGLND